VFEDILLVNDKGIQSLLKEIDNEELAMALRRQRGDETQDLQQHVGAAAQLIKEDMEYMRSGAAERPGVCPAAIVDVVRRLEDAGEIIIAGRGGESDHSLCWHSSAAEGQEWQRSPRLIKAGRRS